MTFAGNKLLEAFSSVVLRRLDVRTQCVGARQTLFDAYEDSADVYFPHASTVVSLIRGTEEGPQVEVGLVGSEGFTSMNSVLTPGSNASTAIVQIGGPISRVGARRLRAEFADDLPTRTLLLAYAALFLEHVTQGSVCNRVHTIEQRLSKWLLIISDRVDGDEFVLSHDILSKMLGIQRSGVTLAIGALTNDGLIEHKRKQIGVRDSKGLEDRACECYGLMMSKLEDYRTRLARFRVMPIGSVAVGSSQPPHDFTTYVHNQLNRR